MNLRSEHARLSLFMLLLLLAVGSRPVLAQPFTFELVEQQLELTSFGAHAWADLNEDGDFDVIYSGNKTPFSSPALAFEAVVLTEKTFIPQPGRSQPRVLYEGLLESEATIPGLWLSGLAVADVDGDGDLDVHASGATGAEEAYAPVASMLINDAERRLNVAASPAHALYAASAAWTDIDNDAWPDLIVAGIADDGSYRTDLYVNSGGVLQERASELPGLANAAIALADYDSDGDEDLALTGREASGRFLAVVYENDDGEYRRAVELDGLAFGSVDWGDYDADGDQDLLVTGGAVGPFVLSGHLRLYLNDNGSLVPTPLDLPGVVGGAARWGDYDNDGLVDILWSGASHMFDAPATRIYQNMGDGTFRHAASLAGAFPSAADWGDYDGDGDLDVMLHGLSRESLPLALQYRNETRVVNNVPSAPVPLRAEVSAGSATIYWEGSTDDETPAPALTYNIRVGSQPGASDVVHGFSDPISGRRQRSEPGNAWNNRRWTLRDLAPGKYYWSVQAIDAAYAGSRFAPEQSFTVGADADGSVATTTEEETLPTTVALQDAFPNPFDSRTALRVTLTEQDVVSLEVFDALGARVRTLTHGPRLAGEHEIIWDGRSDAGHAVSAGLYFCRMRTAAGESGTVKLIRLR